jgi:FMN phosphatase YigB (HAD superfamily)
MTELIALVDMDGTLCDYDGALRAGLLQLRSPGESEEPVGHDDGPPWLEARKNLIKRQMGWWRNLARLEDGFYLIARLKWHRFRLVVLTKGPFNTTSAWTEKVEWCREHLPGVGVTLTEDKGLVYGKVLVDDWPPYVERWLTWRPRGLVIMPDRPWNQGYTHPNVFRFRGDKDAIALDQKLEEIRLNWGTQAE